MRARVRLCRCGTAAVLALFLLTGCTGDEADEAASPVPSDTPSATGTTEPSEAPESPTSEPPESPTSEPTDPPTSEPSESPTSEPPDPPAPEPTDEPRPTDEPQPTEQPPPPTGLRAKLLTSAGLPAPGEMTWESSRVRPGTGSGDISVCQRPGVTLRSIGATKGVQALHQSGTVSARQVVAEFADERSATLGYAVLEAWLGQCEQHAGARGFESVKSPGGYTPLDSGDPAGWALASYGPVPDDPASSYIETQALVRVDDTLSWVVWEQIGQDYNYEPGQAPPERAAPLMADALASS